jgi:hypothetical protein
MFRLSIASLIALSFHWPSRTPDAAFELLFRIRGAEAICWALQEVDDAVDRIVAGMEGTRMTDGKSKSLVAYHEVGHAVCG